MQPVAPPQVAFSNDWMSLGSTGVNRFQGQHPTYDGRGVIVGILDTGIDAGAPGLQQTSTGDPKVLDLRDFSNEGAVPLQRLMPRGDTVEVAGRRMAGFGRVAALNATGPWYAGTLREIPLGEAPAADVNANGVVGDTLAVVVTRATDGWVLLADTDGDGSLADERPVHDYLSGRETFGWAPAGRGVRLTLAANFSEAGGEPVLVLAFDNHGHGTHVAGIAAGNDLYGVPGFDGVAPGAYLLGLKIANGAQGGISTTGSILGAIDYAIRFAQTRRLPLVLNLSFGVGNEVEGAARIDLLIDSVLAVHPELVLTVSAGNDGPGLSTVGFPGSARRAISIGATLPAAFLRRSSNGAAGGDVLAYFSSRGGELAKPDLVTPGVAYSTVARWNRGNEVEQGTSMAAPHAAGLAARLVSALAQEPSSHRWGGRPGRQGGRDGRPTEARPIGALADARAIKQALMVTAQPLPGATSVDEGTGVPDVGRAYEWLRGHYVVPEVEARRVGSAPGSAAALHEAQAAGAIDTVQAFELLRPASAPPATFTLRSDASWLSSPSQITLNGPRTTVQVRYEHSALRAPGVYVGTVTGLSADTLAGPAFRLVNTVVVAHPVAAETRTLRSATEVPAGEVLRTFVMADSARPFELTLASAGLGDRGLAFLHEPYGMPYRGGAAAPVGSGERAAVYRVDARDVVSGPYEVVAVAPPGQGFTATVKATHSPFLLHISREGSQAVATLHNTTAAAAETRVAMAVNGGERVQAVAARGSAVQRVPFTIPPWATTVTVDVTMDRAQWGRFTDFGVTLFDSAGRQIAKQPLNYAFGRLEADVPTGHGEIPATLALFPGFAEPNADESWAVQVSIRMYADSAVSLLPVGASRAKLTVGPGKTARAAFRVPENLWPLPAGWAPLGMLVAETGEKPWTREGALGEAR